MLRSARVDAYHGALLRSLDCKTVAALLLTALGFLPGAADAAREAVLNQVKLPHNYYWRELYIPQLTTGPSSVAFMPSGDELVYSMEGSLWRQGFRLNLPAKSPIRCRLRLPARRRAGRPQRRLRRYDGNAFELWRLDLESGGERALTANGGVNLEPRISPDGRKIAFVSTAGSGHFNLKIADLSPDGPRTSVISSRREKARSTATTIPRTTT